MRTTAGTTQDDRLRITLDSLADPVAVFDGRSSRTVDVNHEFCSTFACSRKEALQLTFGAMSCGDPLHTDREASRWFTRALKEGSQRFEWQCKTTSGRPFWTELTMSGTTIHRRPYVVVHMRKLAGGKRLEEEFAYGRELRQELVERAPFGIALAEAKHDGIEVLYVSDRFTELTGLSRGDLTTNPRNIFDIVLQEQQDDFIRTATNAFRSREILKWTGPVMVRGTLRWLRIESYPMTTPGGAVTWLGIVLDVSEQKHLEVALEKRIVALTQPLAGDVPITFEDLFNLPDIQEIQDLFSRVTGVASIIVRPDGTPITRPSSFHRLWTDILLKTDGGPSPCPKQHTCTPATFACPEAGVLYASTSMTVGGHHVADWLIGQVRDAFQNNEKEATAYAQSVGTDVEEFLKAYRDIPTMSAEQFHHVVLAFSALARQLSSSAYMNVQQARFIDERRTAEEQLLGITRNLPGMVFQTYVRSNGEKGLHYLNEGSTNYLKSKGTTLEEVLESFIAGIDEVDRPRFASSISGAAATGTPWTFEGTYHMPDGSLASLLCRAQPRRMKDELVFDGLILDVTKQKQAEEALRESEQKYRQIVDTATECIVAWDRNAVITFANTQASALLGYRHDELIGMPLTSLMFEDDHPRHKMGMQRIAKGESFRMEHRLRRKDGQAVWLSSSLSPAIDAHGTIIGCFSMASDISQRKQAEEKYSSVLQSLMDGFLLIDPTGKIHDVNDACCNMTGYERTALLSMTLTDLEAVRTHEELTIIIEAAQKARYNRFETVHRRKDGNHIELDVNLQTLPNSHLLFVFLRDITERKRVERKMESMVLLQQTILDTISVGLTYVKDRKQEWANMGFAHLFGYSPEETIHAKTSLYYSTEEEYQRIGREGYPELAKGNVYSTEALMKKKDGTQCWCNIVGKALSPGDPTKGSIWMLQDITERKRTQESLKRSEAILQATIEAMNEGVLVVSADGAVTHANSRFRQIFSIPDDVFATRSDETFLQCAVKQLADSEAFRRRVDEIYDSTSMTEDSVLMADGRILERFSYPLQEDSPVRGRVWLFRDVTERKRTEEALIRSQTLLRESQRVANIGSWELDLITDELHWNEEAYRLHGIPEGAPPLSIASFVDLVVPEDRASLMQHHEESLRSRIFTDFECRIIRGDGQERTIYIAGALKQDESGQPVRMLGIVQDITERKRAEERYTAIIQTAMDGFVIHDEKGTILDANDAMCRISGYSRKESIGRNLADFAVDDTVAHVITDELARLAESGSLRFETRNRRKDGCIIDVEISLNCLHKEKNTFFVFLRDITGQKAALKALKDSQERLQAFMDSATDLCTIWDEDLTLIDMNKITLSYLPPDTRKELLLGSDGPTVFPNSWRRETAEQCREVIRTGVPFSLEHSLQLRNLTVWFFTRIFRVGKGVGIMASDITARKSAEEEIRRMNSDLEKRIAERTDELRNTNKELESFAYTISHDLRAPLRAIDGFTKILLEDHASQLDPEGQRVCSIVCNETRRMGQLVDDLLAFSRLGRIALKRATVDISELAETVFHELIRAEDQARVEFNIAATPPAFGDPRMLRQVMVNLISNAVKFTSKKEHPRIELGSTMRGSSTVYFVRDNGAGFNMQYATKLFGVFHRLHSEEEFEGTGVGLAIVQRIINRHGGEVWAEGEVDTGATFFFTLPQTGETA